MKNLKLRMLGLQAAIIAGLISNKALAGNNFSDIARNINDSIEELPGLLTGLAYMFGLLLGVLGVMKIKDHVENPGNTPLKDGAIRLAAGGALFALPILFEAMQNTIGNTVDITSAAQISKIDFNVT